MKEKILELINNCINNKDFLFHRIKINDNSSIIQQYTGINSYDLEYCIRDIDDSHIIRNNVVYLKERRHIINIIFDEQPGINIESEQSSFTIEKNCNITVQKSFFGIKYNKNIYTDVKHITYKYILIYGKYKFELEDSVVDDIVKLYQENIQKHKNIKYEEQINERIEKYK